MVIISTPFFVSYSSGGVSIVQFTCGTFLGTGNNSPQSLAFFGADVAGNVIAVTVNLQGSTTTTIVSMNATDDHDNTQYVQQIRSVDQGNSLYTGVLTHTIVSSGVPIISVTFHETGGLNLQNLRFCIYELSGTGSSAFQTGTQEGGGNSYTTTSNGKLILSAVASNGNTGAWTSSGTNDLVSASSGIAHSTSAMLWNGVSGSTYSEEADASFGAPDATSTLTGWNFPYFANTANNGAGISWLLGLIILLLPVGLLDTYFIKESPNIDSGTLIFLNFVGLFIGSLFGVMINVLPYALPFIIGSIFVIYMWKGRG